MTDDLHLWSGLYATDALEGDERATYERHLADCPDCQAEVAGFRATTSQLGAVAAEPAPSAARDRVMAEIARTRQDPPVLPAGSSTPDPVIEIIARRQNKWAWMAVAAAFLLLAGAAAVVINGLHGRATRAEQIAEIVARSDARTIELRGDSGPGAKLVWSPGRSQAVLLAENMPQVDPQKTYELWVIRAGTPSKVVLFRPDPTGSIRARFAAAMEDGDVVGVTVEPAGGSPRPTSPIIMSSSAV